MYSFVLIYKLIKYGSKKTPTTVSMKTKMNLLKKFNKGDLPFFFFFSDLPFFVVVVDMGVGNTIIEYLDRVVKIYRHILH